MTDQNKTKQNNKNKKKKKEKNINNITGKSMTQSDQTSYRAARQALSRCLQQKAKRG